VYNWGLRTSIPTYDKARLSNVTGQILTDPQRQVFRDTIANAVRLRGGIYSRNVRRIQKHSRQAVQCCRPWDKVLFICTLLYRHCQNGNIAPKFSMNVENSLEAVQMLSHPGKYMEGLRKIMRNVYQKKPVWRSRIALDRSVIGLAFSLGYALWYKFLSNSSRYGILIGSNTVCF